jgi:hypothetical protein
MSVISAERMNPSFTGFCLTSPSAGIKEEESLCWGSSGVEDILNAGVTGKFGLKQRVLQKFSGKAVALNRPASSVSLSPPSSTGTGTRTLIGMTRGDQRERAREKNLKKKVSQAKGTSLPEGMSLAQKKEL